MTNLLLRVDQFIQSIFWLAYFRYYWKTHTTKLWNFYQTLPFRTWEFGNPAKCKTTKFPSSKTNLELVISAFRFQSEILFISHRQQNKSKSVFLANIHSVMTYLLPSTLTLKKRGNSSTILSTFLYLTRFNFLITKHIKVDSRRFVP